jgi:hypothetical protein
MSIRMPETNCPSCKKILDAATPMEEGATPSPGDVSVCCYCHAVLQYSDDMRLIHADADVIAEVTLELSRAQRFARSFNEIFGD